MKTLWKRWIGAVLPLLAFALPAMAEGPLHARVSHDAGSLLVRGTEASEWAFATTNTIVLPGDTLWIDETGLGEVELPQGSFLRLADSSKIEVTSVSPTTSLRAWNGSFYLQRLTRSSGGLVMETPAATLDIQPDTSVRVDVLPAGNTTVSVRWGQVALRTRQGGAVNISSGQRVYVDPGLLPSTPVAFDRTIEDDFDLWSRERSEYIATGGSVPEAVTVAPATLGVSDLSHHGEWVYVDQRPYWRPTIVTNYVPYRNGYWNYVPVYGHVWVGTTPFDYVTSHYGRWSYVNRYGWCWSYDPVWRPAWAVTVRYGDYYAWAPCDYYNRPVLVHDSAYFSVGGVRFSVGSTSWVGYNDIYRGPRYVSPWQSNPYYGHQGPDTVVNINIWNIDNRQDRPTVNPFPNDRFTVRDYNPPRSIRGVQSLDSGNWNAVDRAQRLEQSYGRNQFAGASRSRDAQTRTAIEPTSRQASVRNVRVEDRGSSAFTRTDARPVNRGAVRGESAVTIDNRTGERTNARPINRVEGGSRETRGVENGPSRQTRTPAPDAGTGRSTVTPDRTVVPDRGATREGGRSERGNAVTTQPRQERGNSEVGRTQVPRNAEVAPRGGVRDNTGNVSRTPVTRESAPTQRPSTTRVEPRTQVPSARVERVETRGNQRTVAPQSTPRYTVPNRESSRGPAVRQSAPSVTRESPRIERSAPTTPSPSYAPRQTQSAPEPRYTAPAPSRQNSGRSEVRVQPVQPVQSRPQAGYSGRSQQPSSTGISAPRGYDRGGRSQSGVRGESSGRGR